MLVALDHVAIFVRDLEAETRAYERLLGSGATFRGAGDGAAYVLFSLANCELGLFAATGAGALGDRVRARLEHDGDGLAALGFAANDLEKVLHKLARRGLGAGGVQRLRAEAATSGAERERAYAWLDREPTHGVSLCIVENAETRATPPHEPAALFALDHVVVNTSLPERALALYGARLGLELALDRTNPAWGSRLMFFRCGDLVIEIAHALRAPASDGPDSLWGLAFRAGDVVRARARLAQAGFDVSEVRNGRKPGTAVFSVRNGTAQVPSLVIGALPSE